MDFGFEDIIKGIAGGINVASGIANLFGGNSNSRNVNRPMRQSSLEQKLLETAGMGQQIGLDAMGYAAGPFGAYRRPPTADEFMRQQFSRQLTNAISGRVGGAGQLNMGGQGGVGGGLRDRQSLVNMIQERMGAGGQIGGGTVNGANPSQQLVELLQKLGLNRTA